MRPTVLARYQAMPPSSRESVIRSTVESKKAPALARGVLGLGQRAVEQVGQRGEDDQQRARARRCSAPMATAAPTPTSSPRTVR